MIQRRNFLKLFPAVLALPVLRMPTISSALGRSRYRFGACRKIPRASRLPSGHGSRTTLRRLFSRLTSFRATCRRWTGCSRTGKPAAA